jgi:uncharacterized protein (TIGR02231 family)
MKRALILITAGMSCGLLAGQNDKSVDSKITRVTVFLQQAQVTREARTSLAEGKTDLVVGGLTAILDPSSIQVSGKGSFVILGINHRHNYLTELNTPKSIRMLKDSIDIVQKAIEFEQTQFEILTKEEQLLNSNQKIGGTSQNLTAAELKAMADFYRGRMTDIVVAKNKSTEKIKKLTQRKSRLQAQMNELTDTYSRNTSEIVVSVSAQSATPAELEIMYIVGNAGWTPQYDLRAQNAQNPIQLSYRGSVFQSTGEEWKNVKLRLSTANPTLGGLKPELATWYLDFYQPRPVTYDYRSRSKAAASMPAYRATDEEELKTESVAELQDAGSLAEYVSTIQTSLNTEFDISLPYSVSSGRRPTLVDIRSDEVKASYLYSVAPKLDKDAFLIAKATGWEEFNLLPGNANIFFEGTYVGQSFIDPNSIKDTLSLSLGRDPRIVVKREKVKEFSSRKAIGGTQRDSYAWETTLRNSRNQSVTLLVEDQVPVSKNSQIEVTVTDMGGAAYNRETGKLTWRMTLAPNESRKVSFRYEVKYPKDKIVEGL